MSSNFLKVSWGSEIFRGSEKVFSIIIALLLCLNATLDFKIFKNVCFQIHSIVKNMKNTNYSSLLNNLITAFIGLMCHALLKIIFIKSILYL